MGMAGLDHARPEDGREPRGRVGVLHVGEMTITV
jgi:hypothetical protein